MKYVYKVRYAVETGEFTKESLEKDGCGGADAVIIHSILFPPDGSRSQKTFSISFDETPLSVHQLFVSWALWANAISQHPDLDENKKAICEQAFEAFRELLGNKE